MERKDVDTQLKEFLEFHETERKEDRFLLEEFGYQSRTNAPFERNLKGEQRREKNSEGKNS